MYDKVYFIGIGGIGMSAIARYYKAKGLEVSGYDRTPSDLTRALEAEGMDIHYEPMPERIPEDKEHCLVVYTPAIPQDMPELEYVREKGYRLLKRSRTLGEIAKGQRCLAVAGTHGKTTTSTLLAHIYKDSGAGCSAFLGGISKNYDTNLLISDNPVIVAEADEFDRSFLQLFPSVAVITAMDADHLDIYGDVEHVREAFRAFASQVSDTLIIKYGLPIGKEDSRARILSYSYDNKEADFHAENIVRDELGCLHFDLVYPEGRIENIVAAAAVALCGGIAPEAIRKAVASFQGVKRRFDIHFNRPGCTYIDDYAHHPKELSSTIRAIREVYPGRKICAIFQPHLYTRTRDFADEFAEALSAVDKLILLDIYPARELPIPGVSSEMILGKVKCPEKLLLHKEELMDYLKKEPLDILVSFGAGDIDRFIVPISKMLEERN
mgnify:FL=1